VNIIESDRLNAKVEQGLFDALLSVDVERGRLREPMRRLPSNTAIFPIISPGPTSSRTT
tara:strand:- start:101 stop:277 length:177 start_codon:yes stop_codon:yes gene_type:complete